MQWKKLNRQQKLEKHWRDRRNRLVSKLLAENPKMLSAAALAEANRVMRERDAKAKDRAGSKSRGRG